MIKRTTAWLAAGLLLATGRTVVPQDLAPLEVRRDAYHPGAYFVGVAPGIGREVPITVDVQVGDESAPPRSFRSPEPGRFDLCPMLKQLGAAATPGNVHLTIHRGAAVARKSFRYDGAACQGGPGRAARAPSATAESTTR